MLTYLTLVEDRYSGVYSGAQFTLWEGEPPDFIDGGDVECSVGWCNEDIECLAKGNSVGEVLNNFINSQNVNSLNELNYNLIVYKFYIDEKCKIEILNHIVY